HDDRSGVDTTSGGARLEIDLGQVLRVREDELHRRRVVPQLAVTAQTRHRREHQRGDNGILDDGSGHTPSLSSMPPQVPLTMRGVMKISNSSCCVLIECERNNAPITGMLWTNGTRCCALLSRVVKIPAMTAVPPSRTMSRVLA